MTSSAGIRLRSRTSMPWPLAQSRFWVEFRPLALALRARGVGRRVPGSRRAAATYRARAPRSARARCALRSISYSVPSRPNRTVPSAGPRPGQRLGDLLAPLRQPRQHRGCPAGHRPHHARQLQHRRPDTRRIRRCPQDPPDRRRPGNAGLTTRIIERRVGGDFRAAQGECHVALLGVDNQPTRRLTSGAGWTLAIDTGLGDQPGNFDSILIHRFLGSQPSDTIPAWQPQEPHAVTIPATPAFADPQEHHDPCGVTELAGKAVGAAIVGVTARCLAIAEALRELHGGTGHDTLLLSLTTTTARTSPGGQIVRVPSAPLRQ